LLNYFPLLSVLKLNMTGVTTFVGMDHLAM